MCSTICNNAIFSVVTYVSNHKSYDLIVMKPIINLMEASIIDYNIKFFFPHIQFYLISQTLKND